MELTIKKYDPSLEEKWDRFVMEKSVNGTFLQTRNFLNYHPDGRFNDASILVYNASNIVAVIPGNEGTEDGLKTFFSHQGSTFGGIVLEKSAYNVSTLECLVSTLDAYFVEQGYEKVILKSTSDLFSEKSMALLDYELFRFGYGQYDEIAFYLECASLPEDGLSMMTASRRRDCRYSFKNNFELRPLTEDAQVTRFHEILTENLKKFDATPVHTLDELLEFKNSRLSDIVRFYGVYDGDELVAGTMLFCFGKRVLHTQYLACLPEYNRKFAMNFMDYNLILIAREQGFEYFSFGTSTGNRGKDLNVGLALYKEGFGCSYSVNRSYLKTFDR